MIKKRKTKNFKVYADIITCLDGQMKHSEEVVVMTAGELYIRVETDQ
jgi:hypothetical protein